MWYILNTGVYTIVTYSHLMLRQNVWVIHRNYMSQFQHSVILPAGNMKQRTIVRDETR